MQPYPPPLLVHGVQSIKNNLSNSSSENDLQPNPNVSKKFWSSRSWLGLTDRQDEPQTKPCRWKEFLWILLVLIFFFILPTDKNLPNSSSVEVEVTPPMNGTAGQEGETVRKNFAARNSWIKVVATKKTNTSYKLKEAKCKLKAKVCRNSSIARKKEKRKTL